MTNNPNYNLGGKNLRSSLMPHGSIKKKKGVKFTQEVSDDDSSQQMSLIAAKKPPPFGL